MLNKLLLKQEYAIYYLKDKETEELLYGGAAGGGKSALGCLWLIEMCQTYPGTRWLLGRATLKTLKETTLNSFFEISSKLQITGQYKFNAKDNVINWKNGSQILLKDLAYYPSDPNFDSLGSLEITGAFIDECNQLLYKAWQIVKSRIRYKLTDFGLIPKMLGTCNPAKNWTYKEFYKPHRDKQIEPFRKFIMALPKDNPNLEPTYLKSLLRLDNNSRQRLYYGNWEYDNDPATLIDNDSISDYFVKSIEDSHVKPEGQKYLTIDVARKGKDKTVFRVWHGLLCISRKEIAKSGLDEVVKQAKELQRLNNISLSNTIADEDGVGGGVVDFLKCKGFVNNSSPLEIRDAHKKVKPNFDNLKSQCSVKMAELIVTKKAAEVCDDDYIMQSTSEEMEQVKIKDIDKDGKQGIVSKDKIKEQIGRSPDDWDSIMMRYWFEINKPIQNNIDWNAFG